MLFDCGTDRAAVERGVRSLTDAKGTEAGCKPCVSDQQKAVITLRSLWKPWLSVSGLRGGHVALTTSHGTCWPSLLPFMCVVFAQLVPGTPFEASAFTALLWA